MALSTSRTLVTKTGISTTQVFDMGGINISGGDFNIGSAIKLGNASGIITSTNFKTGSSNLHSTGLNVSNTFVHSTGIALGAGSTVGAVTGVTTYYGDGSQLSGIDFSAVTGATGDFSIVDKIIHTGDTNTAIRFPANDTVSIETAGNEQVKFNHTTGTVLYNHIVPNNDSTKDIGLTGTRFRSAYVDNYYGSGANLTNLPAQATIANNADNRVITGGSGVNLNGEANLTFDGQALTIGSGYLSVRQGALPQVDIQNSTDTSYARLYLAQTSGSGGYFAINKIGTNGGGYTGGSNAAQLWLSSNAPMLFATNNAERLRITSDGKMGVGLTNPQTLFDVTGTSVVATLKSTNNNYVMQMQGNNASDKVFFGTTSGNDFVLANTSSVTERLRIKSDGKVGINQTSPQRILHIGTSGTAEANIRLQGGADYAELRVKDSDNCLSIHTNFAGGGSDEKVRIFGNTSENILQLKGGVNLSISDGAYSQGFSGTYNGWHVDNHGNCVIGLNAHLNYSGSSGTHQWKQTNAHGSIGSAGMFIGGNGSNNNSDICFFRNGQGSSAGTTFSQDSWKFKIGSEIVTNYNVLHRMRGYFRSSTSSQTASNAPALAGSLGYGYGYQEAYSTSGGAWNHPYPDLVLGYHTGVSLGGYPNYGGCRFFTDHPSSSSTMIFSVGNGGSGVHVTNTLSKGGGSFRIAHPHPSKKYTHDLQHSFIEGPQCDNIYRGKIDLVAGSASINIDTVSNMTDGTFVLLNRDIQCFTSNETGWTAVKGSVSGNILTITAQDNSCTDTISWMVIGERQDDKIKSPEMELTDSDGKLIVEPLTIEETHM